MSKERELNKIQKECERLQNSTMCTESAILEQIIELLELLKREL